MAIRLRFSLRSLWIALTIVAVLLGWVAWNLHQVRERVWLQSNIGGVWFGGAANPGHSLPLVWSLLGCEPNSDIYVADSLPVETIHRLQTAFPEAEIHCVPDPRDYSPHGHDYTGPPIPPGSKMRHVELPRTDPDRRQ